MSDLSPGAYVIDDDYTIVSYNRTVKDLYPQIVLGEKCHKCLMGLDEPCPPCPVANHNYGPRTYLDPIRDIYETVDAVELMLENGRTGHALVVSTVGDAEVISAKLPRTDDELQRLLEQKFYDTVTDGYSRQGFIRETSLVFEEEDPTEYSVVVFDISNFKAINDTLGIEGGDRVLSFVFDTLRASWMQPSVAARLESDWFVFLVRRDRIESENINGLTDIEWNRDGQRLTLRLRCGIYNVEDGDVSVPKMIERAVIAKGFANREGYRRSAVFTEPMLSSYVSHAEIAAQFQNSLANGDFKLYFQPIIRAKDERVCAAEALVRWERPAMGAVMPGAFIPVLEQENQISQLDRYMLRKVYAFQESLARRGIGLVPVSLNLSRQDFYNDGLMNEVFALAARGTVPRGSVNYEVTETSVAVLRDNCTYLLGQMRDAGAKILLDDFGSGYSSLGMVGNYPFDIVKIDKSFVEAIEQKTAVRAVIASTIEMCHSIGLKTVAEGVETREQFEFLRQNGCDFIQGYYFFKPMDEDAFVSCLESGRVCADGTREDDEGQTRGEVDLFNLIDLVDHSGQFIQVCHPEDYTMVFANELTRVISGHPDEPYQGKLCFKYMLGADAPCGHCPMRQMGDEKEKVVEVDDGDHVFQLKARYALWNGRKVFIEYGRDVTNVRAAQLRYTRRMRSIIENMPDGQGVFHVDLSADEWLSSSGIAKNAQRMQNVGDVDTLIRMIAAFVPDAAGRERFYQTFCREHLLEEFARGKNQILLETESYYDDQSIRWSRITAHLLENPGNNHVESVIYGIDISSERTYIASLEREKEIRQGLEREGMHDAGQRAEDKVGDMQRVWGMYALADRDRRHDYLTGLNSRLDLYDALERARNGSHDPITAVFMVDIDDFKDVNDAYGHTVGDKCLAAFGDALNQFGSDHDVSFYRFGGDEIVGLAHDDVSRVPQLASSLLAVVRDLPVGLEMGKTLHLTASIGYTTVLHGYQEAIDAADRAMYAAKRRGKNQVACIDE
jgi:diguanylate cyclase (GGDEF)-like protein